MPAPYQQGHLREAAILTRAVENVLRKLTRLLIGRISLTRLQELMRLIFVEEAEAFLKREKPGKNVPMTKLALLTGLDTRTLGRLKEESATKRVISESSDFLKGFNPGFRVLDHWLNDPRFLDAKTGQPKPLKLTGSKHSFESLVNSAVKSRGMTSKSILERLLENCMVVVDKGTNTVTLREGGIIFLGNDELDMIDIGFAAVANLISTVAHNVRNAGDASNRFFQRSCWTYKLSRSNQISFRDRMLRFLENANRDARATIQPFEETEELKNSVMAGISMFYFEEIAREPAEEAQQVNSAD